MLVQVTSVSVGDEISSARGGGTVSQIETHEDGSVRIDYIDGTREWFESGQIVVKKDKFNTFFTGAV